MSTETIATPLTLLQAKDATHMTYRQIGAAAQIGHSTVHDVMTGSQPHHFDTVRRIVDVLNSALPKDKRLDARQVFETFATNGRPPGIAEDGRLYVQAPATCPRHYVVIPMSGVCDECD